MVMQKKMAFLVVIVLVNAVLVFGLVVTRDKGVEHLTADFRKTTFE